MYFYRVLDYNHKGTVYIGSFHIFSKLFLTIFQFFATILFTFTEITSEVSLGNPNF